MMKHSERIRIIDPTAVLHTNQHEPSLGESSGRSAQDLGRSHWTVGPSSITPKHKCFGAEL
jgi:hypothetical protein